MSESQDAPKCHKRVEGERQLRLYTHNGKLIVYGTGEVVQPEVDEHEAANRVLVFPELLAACKDAEWALAGDEYDPERFTKAILTVRAAIAKAEPK